MKHYLQELCVLSESLPTDVHMLSSVSKSHRMHVSMSLFDFYSVNVKRGYTDKSTHKQYLAPPPRPYFFSCYL